MVEFKVLKLDMTQIFEIIYDKFKILKAHLEYLVVDGEVILKWILKTCVVRTWTGLFWLRTGYNGGQVLPGSIKTRNFLIRRGTPNF